MEGIIIFIAFFALLKMLPVSIKILGGIFLLLLLLFLIYTVLTQNIKDPFVYIILPLF